MDRQAYFDWIPLILIICGLILAWIGVDDGFLVMYAGFLAYGLLGLIEVLSRTMPRRSFLWIFKIIVLSLILITALISLVATPSYFIVLLSLVLCDRLILTMAR